MKRAKTQKIRMNLIIALITLITKIIITIAMRRVIALGERSKLENVSRSVRYDI